ncbi:MAG: hypothetical protein ABIO02_00710 [Patescibacteria group bacterium]
MEDFSKLREILGTYTDAISQKQESSVEIIGPYDPTLSKLGAKIFRTVSIHYPFSFTAQSVAIAKFCQDDGRVSPLDLHGSLIRDSKQMKEVTKKANNMHKAIGKGPPNPLTEAQVLAVINGEFSLAQELMILDPSQIDEVLGLSEKYRLETISVAQNKEMSWDEVKILQGLISNDYQNVAINMIELQKRKNT